MAFVGSHPFRKSGHTAEIYSGAGNDQIPAPEADLFMSYSICDYICAMVEESICLHNYCLIFIGIQTFKH